MSFDKNNTSLNKLLSQNPMPPSGFPEMDLEFFQRTPKTSLDEMSILREKKSRLGKYASVASLLIVTGAFVAYFIPNFQNSGQAKQRVAVVLQVSGTAQVTKSDQAQLFLKKGDPINEGQIIKTSPDSHVDLSLPKGILVRIAPSSTYQLHTINTKNSGDIHTQLHQGSVYSLVEKLSANENFTITTPTAIAGVRGTSFRVSTSDKNTTSVHLIQGSVYIKNPKNLAKEYILDKYEKNFIEIQENQVLSHTHIVENDFSDVRQIDNLGKHLKSSDTESLVIDKKGLKRAQKFKKERQQLYSIIRLQDGSEVHGFIISQNAGKIFVETKTKSRILQSTEVAEIKFVDSQ